MNKLLLICGLLLVASACGVDRESENAVPVEETETAAEDGEDASGEDDAGEGGADDAPLTTAPLPPSEPPETGPDDEVAISADFGDEQWELTHGEFNEVALSVWGSDDFIRRGFGGAVPAGFYATVAGEHLVGKVLARELAAVGTEVSDDEREAARGTLLELVTSWYGDTPDPEGDAEALMDDVSYLGFVSDLQADQQVLLAALSEEGGETIEVPCVSHILLEEEAEAQDVLAELEGGADFAELAMERSTGPSGPSGGDLGCASSAGYVPEFAEAVDTAEEGEFVGPVQTEFGWHVLVVQSFEDQPADPTVELNERISETLSSASIEVDPLIGSWDTELLQIVAVPTEEE